MLQQPQDLGLHHIFDAKLTHLVDAPPLQTEGDGALIGSGKGVVTGPVVSGTLRWTLFEHPGTLVCAMNPVLVLDTQDGASIRIDGRGYARRDSESSSVWRVAATLQFETDDGDYAWLEGALGFWEGEFVAHEGRASYRAYTSAAPEVPAHGKTRPSPDPGSRLSEEGA